MNLASLLNQSTLLFSEFWAARDARERSMLAVAALVVTFALAYAVLINPALGGREQLNKSLPVLRQQVAQMQTLSKQAAALSAKPVAPPIPMSRENIEAALARNGMKAQSVILSGDFAKVPTHSIGWMICKKPQEFPRPMPISSHCPSPTRSMRHSRCTNPRMNSLTWYRNEKVMHCAA
jgi:hypothetical protein